MSNVVTVPDTSSPMHQEISAYVAEVMAANPERYTGRWSYHVFLEEVGGTGDPHIFRSMDESGREYSAEDIVRFNQE